MRKVTEDDKEILDRMKRNAEDLIELADSLLRYEQIADVDIENLQDYGTEIMNAGDDFEEAGE